VLFIQEQIDATDRAIAEEESVVERAKTKEEAASRSVATPDSLGG
jgi:hypothetical protein